MSDIVERLNSGASTSRHYGLHLRKYQELCNEAASELSHLKAENERLRATLANSKSPCAYCDLPADEWAKCKFGFPGCGRADDVVGCPELGASLEARRLKARVEELEAELNRLNEDLLFVMGWNEGFEHALTETVNWQFPTMLRKMWSGGEVQKWVDERKVEARAARALKESE